MFGRDIGFSHAKDQSSQLHSTRSCPSRVDIDKDQPPCLSNHNGTSHCTVGCKSECVRIPLLQCQRHESNLIISFNLKEFVKISEDWSEDVTLQFEQWVSNCH